MAAVVTLLGSTFDTNSGTHTVVATPAVGDVIVIVEANTGNTNPTLPSDNNSDGLSSYTNQGASGNSLKNTSADLLKIYIRQNYIGSATSTTFTVAAGTTTGGGLAVLKVTGITRDIANALRQAGIQQNQASGTPTISGLAAILTTSAVIGAVFNGASPAGMTPRSSPAYSELLDTGYASPTTGIEIMSINSGETATSIAWGSSSATPFSAALLEVDARTVTAALTGTATSTITSADIVAGGKTIVLTLTNAQWLTAGATFDAQRQNIINGLTSAQSEAHGWNIEVKAKIAVTDVVRTSATVVTITLDAEALYSITAQETITATVPVSAFGGAGSGIVASPTFTVSVGSSDSTVNVSDTEAITESVTMMVESYVNKSEPVSLSESTNQALESNLSASDTAVITDTVTAQVDANPSASDSEVVTDSQGLLIPVLFASVSDSLAATDSVVINELSFVSKSDTAVATDAVQLSVTDSLSVSDTAAITDAKTVMADTAPRVSDSITLSESQTLFIPTLFVSTSDSISETEAVLLTEPEGIGISDNMSVTDSTVLLIPTLFVSTSDTAVITDSTARMAESFVSKSDTAAITDSVVLSPTSFVAVSDTEAITDATTDRLTSFIAVNDTEAVTDAVTIPIVSYQVSVSDTEAISDAVSVSIPSANTLSISVSDTASITDATTANVLSFVSVSNSTAITDSTALLIPNLYLTVSDSLSLAEAILLTEPESIGISDNMSVADSVSLLIPFLLASVNNTIAITDTVVAPGVSYQINKSEPVSLSESASVVATVAGQINISGSDTIAITESVTLQELGGANPSNLLLLGVG